MRKIISFLMMAVFSASLFAATYTVAGSSAAAFGSSWNPENTANDMTLVDGVYTLVKEGVTLPAGTLEYKVCQDHAWTTCWPGDGQPNAKLEITEAGKYTLTFTFVESTGTVNASAQKTEDAQVDPKVSIKGAWDSWAEVLELNLAEDKKSASYVMAVATATTYEFKVIVGDGDWRSDEHIFTRDDASTTGMTGNSNTNLKLVADVAGNYTFTWTFASNALVITFPEKGDDPTPPTPAEKDSIYFVNAQGWAAPKVHLWGGTADATTWPGVEMAKEAEKINNYDVYKFVADKGAYLSCIFNNSGAEGEQTADLAWTSGKYFYEDAWYAKENIPVPGAPVDSATIYYVNAQDWTIVQAFVWLEGSGSYKAWPGEEMTKTATKALEKDVYSYTFPSKYTSIIFNNKVGEDGDQTKDLSWSKEKPYYYDGEWFATIEDIKPVVAAKFYVTGDSALIIDAGLPIAKKWASDAIKSESDTCVITLKADQDYQLALTVDGTWETKKTYADLSKTIPGLYDVDGENHNVGFKLNTAGQVKIVYFEKDEQVTFELIGDFYVKHEEPVDSTTLYFANVPAWEPVKAFVWLESAYKDWPGENMVKTDKKVNGKDVYSYTFPSKYTSIIFNNGNSGEGNQTSDEVAAWDAAKPYFYDGKWYASLEDIPAVEPETPAKYYLAGTMNEWNIGANEFVGEGDTLRLSVALEADSVYKYKVVKVAGDTTWYGTDYAVIMEYGNSTDWHLDGNEDAGLHTTKAANYEFIYIPKDNNRIDVIIPAPKEYTYTITGDSLLMGSDWDPEDVTNDMVYDAEAGVYKLEKKNVPLGVHLYSYPYKVVRDHAWGEGQYPETGDYFINVKEPGMYTLTFTYEPANQILNAYAQKTADMEKDVTVYFVKKEAWDTVYAYFWIDQTDVGYILWPGEKMTLTDKVLNDVANDTAYAVYSYSFPSMFTKIIFNNGEGGTGNQTADMSWSTAKPYYYDGVWYESLEAINPAAETKFYITGNVALVGAGNPWDPKAIKSMEDSYTLDLKAGTYEMLLYLDGTTATMKGYDDLTAKTPGLTSSGDAIRFRLKEAGQVVVTYKEVDATVTFTVTGSFYTVEDGYYLAGQGMWTGLDLYAYRKFVANESKPGEYVSNEITLYENDYIQAVKVVDNAIDQWYADTYYTVDANHAGVKVVYFSPDYNEAWAEFGGYMYIAPNELTAIDNAAAEGKAVKMIKNGMLIIEKGGKLYNVMGIQIR